MIDNVADPGSAEIMTAADFESLIMVDRRAYHSPLVDRNKRQQRYDPKLRPWGEVRGITLHQTACDMGERIARYDTIGAHFSVLRSGRVLWHCDSNRVVYHAQAWNKQCVGIEVNGLYSGLEDDPDTAQDEALRTTWDNPQTPTREQPMIVTPHAMSSLRMLVRWICFDTARHGGQIKVLVAHRQSSRDRPNDPGEAIWKGAAVPLHAELGLTDGGPGFVLGSGLPVPEAWDPNRRGVRY